MHKALAPGGDYTKVREMIGGIPVRTTMKSTIGKIEIACQNFWLTLAGLVLVTSTLADVGIGTPTELLKEADLVAVVLMKWDDSGRGKIVLKEILKGTPKTGEELFLVSETNHGARLFERTLFKLTNRGQEPFLFVGGYNENDHEAYLGWIAHSAWPHGRAFMGHKDLQTLDECVTFAKRVIADQQLMAVMIRDAAQGGISPAPDNAVPTDKGYQGPENLNARNDVEKSKPTHPPKSHGGTWQRFPKVSVAVGVVALFGFAIMLFRLFRNAA